MLPFDQKPWAKTVAMCVIVSVLVGTSIYAILIEQNRRLDWGERAILILLLLTVIPPNIAILRRKGTNSAGTRPLQDVAISSHPK